MRSRLSKSSQSASASEVSQPMIRACGHDKVDDHATNHGKPERLQQCNVWNEVWSYRKDAMLRAKAGSHEQGQYRILALIGAARHKLDATTRGLPTCIRDRPHGCTSVIGSF